MFSKCDIFSHYRHYQKPSILKRSENWREKTVDPRFENGSAGQEILPLKLLRRMHGHVLGKTPVEWPRRRRGPRRSDYFTAACHSAVEKPTLA